MGRFQPSSPIRVLVVDDEPDFADLTATYLERSDEPIDVATATGAEEGLALLGEDRFDCVVSDYDMSGIDGLEFLEAVSERFDDLPFVLFTGKGSEEIASRAISAGVTDYLQKSGSTEQFERLVNRVVHAAGSRRARSEAEGTRAHLETILESATDVVLTVDESSTITFVNRAVEDVFGYTPDELEGEPLTTLMPERFREEHLDGVERYVETGEREVDWSRVEFTGLHREGHEIPLSISFGEFTRNGERYFTGILRDVSDREQLERELRTEKEHFRMAIENSPFTAFRLDTDLRYTWVGNPHEDFDESAVIGKRDDDLLPPEAAETVMAPKREALETGERVREEVTYELPSGEVTYDLTVEPLRDDDGEIVGLTCASIDITEQKRRERELERERAFVENALDALEEVFFVFDGDGSFLRWNGRLTEVTGYTDAEVESMRPADFFADEDAERVEAAVEECLRTGETRVEATIETADGERIPYELRGRVLVGPDGERIGVAGIGRDVSERRARERELTRYETVVEALDDSVWMVDEDCVLTFVNGQVADQLSLPREEVVGRHLSHILGGVEGLEPEVVESFLADVEAVVRGECERVHREMTLPRGGARVVRDVHVVPVESDGEVVGAAGVNRDITELKRLQSELEETLDRITDAFFALDEEWRFTYVNDRAEELLDRSRGELLGENVWEEFEAATDLAFYEEYHRAMETQEPVAFEEFFPPLDAWFAVRAYPSETGLSVYFRDVTEERRRKGRLAGLNEVLAAFLLVDGPEDLCEVVGERAAESLDLPVTAVALFDDGSGSLEPLGRTPEASEHLDWSALLGSGGVAWESFTAGEPVVVEDSDAAVDDSHPATHLLVYPLGRHGVFLTAVEAPDGVSKAEEDFVETVVSNVESTLDRLEREASYRERESLVEEQRAWLDHLNRVNEVIRRVDRSLVSAGTLEEVERLVCEELVAGEGYRFAWVGGYDATAGRVEPRESAGDGQGFLPASPPEADGDAPGEGPAEDAARTREPVVVEDVLSEPPLEPWRRAALDRGFRSCMAVPLVYRDRLYGVLTLYADAPDSFGDLEREVLAELGTTIAHTMNAIESRRALVSDDIVELEFGLDPSSVPLFEPFDRDADCDVVLDDVVPASGGEYRAFLRLRNAEGEAVERLKGSPVVRDCSLIVDRDGTSALECTLTDKSLIAWLLDHGAVPLSLSTGDRARMTVELSREADVRDIVEQLRGRCGDVELLARRARERTVRGPGGFRSELEERLTPRQEEVLRTAYRSGFFESPRRHTGQEVAASLDISQPTFSEHLRAATRKLLRMLYGEDGGAGTEEGDDDPAVTGAADSRRWPDT